MKTLIIKYDDNFNIIEAKEINRKGLFNSFTIYFEVDMLKNHFRYLSEKLKRSLK